MFKMPAHQMSVSHLYANNLETFDWRMMNETKLRGFATVQPAIAQLPAKTAVWSAQ
jgi:hypothetical protein